MIAVKINNKVIENYFKKYFKDNFNKYIEKIIFEHITNTKSIPNARVEQNDQIKIFDELLKYNKRYNLVVKSKTNISQIANEVNNEIL